MRLLILLLFSPLVFGEETYFAVASTNPKDYDYYLSDFPIEVIPPQNVVLVHDKERCVISVKDWKDITWSCGHQKTHAVKTIGGRVVVLVPEGVGVVESNIAWVYAIQDVERKTLLEDTYGQK